MPRKQSTRFATRLTICFAVPALLFATAVGVGVWGLVRTQSEFDVYMATNQRVAEGYTELYAQSLQEGQAIRNMLLDPGNPREFDNLREGQEASRKAFAAIAAAVADEPAATAKLKVIEALREARETALSQVASVVTTDFSRAKALLVTYETPAWRTLRAELIEQRRLSTDAAQASHSSAQVRSRQAVAAAAALAVFALACGLVLGWFMRRSVGQELGGEPSQARDALKRIAAGDLSVAIASGHHPGSLMAELASTQRGLGQLIAEIRGTSDRIQLASTEVANGNADLSQRTELAAANLQQTAASMGDLTGAVTQSAATAVAASQVADKASGVAQRGGEVVSQVVATMTDISASSRKVSDIIGVIDGIAFQTNILALNAAVEAARAGDKGRGFAVVAQEVRHLAHRSSEAAREIKGLIGHSVERVAFGAQLVHSAGQTMSEILVSVVELRNLVNEISARSGGQSDGIGRVNLAVSHLDQMTQSNAALVEQSSAAAESLKSQANLLGAIAARFRLDATPIA